MSQILFSNAAFLAGLAALAIPILIHLFLRRKRLRLRFSTLQFLVNQDARSGLRRRLSNWLLLAARLLVLALVVVAFAQPYLPNSASSTGARERRVVVFVLDRSASMQAAEGGASRWAKAKDLLLKALDRLAPDDRAALVDSSSATALAPLTSPEQLKAQAAQVQPGCGDGDLAEGLRQAARLLSARNVHGQLGVRVISDLQRQDCQALDKVTLPQNVELQVWSVGETNTPNFAISAHSASASDGSVRATFANFSREPAAGLTLDWAVDGHTTATTSLTLAPDSTTNVTTSLPALKPGWHQIEARLRSHDAFPLDDTRCQALQIPIPLKVLCIEPRQTEHVFEQESFFLVSALEPGLGETNALPLLFDIEKIDSGVLVGNLTRDSASPYQIVLMPAVRRLPNGCGKALLDYVRSGGGVLFFVGEGLSAIEYNSELRGLLPAALGNVEGQSQAFEKYWRLGDFDTKSTAFAAFRNPGSGDLTLPRFWRRYAVTPVQGAQVLARFGDKTPFLLARAVGKGRVALVDTSADTSWSDWPKHPTFVPWLYGVCHYLAGDEMSLGAAPQEPFVAGVSADVDLGVRRANQALRVHPPAGPEVGVRADARGQVSLSLERPGFYSVVDSAGRPIRLLAVNPPRRESDLAAFTPSQFQQRILRTQATPQAPSAFGLFDSTGGERHLWRALMLAGALLLIAEILFANRIFP